MCTFLPSVCSLCILTTVARSCTVVQLSRRSSFLLHVRCKLHVFHSLYKGHNVVLWFNVPIISGISSKERHKRSHSVGRRHQGWLGPTILTSIRQSGRVSLDWLLQTSIKNRLHQVRNNSSKIKVLYNITIAKSYKNNKIYVKINKI